MVQGACQGNHDREQRSDTVDEFLEGALNDIDDSDALYKIRRARQLLELAKQRHRDHDEAIEELIGDDEVLNDLRDLGYVG